MVSEFISCENMIALDIKFLYRIFPNIPAIN